MTPFYRIPEHIRNHRSWNTSSNVHTINGDVFPRAVEGDTCMLGWRIYLCTGNRSGDYPDQNGQWWIFLGCWNYDLGRAIMRRAYRIDTGKTSWRWKDAELRPVQPREGYMTEVPRGP